MPRYPKQRIGNRYYTFHSGGWTHARAKDMRKRLKQKHPTWSFRVIKSPRYFSTKKSKSGIKIAPTFQVYYRKGGV